jgi:Ser/Thr protein kinase RdoA (MazF antagonist)
MQRFPEIDPVLSLYPADCQPGAVEFLGAAGGFSGAKIWRVTAARGSLCLRRWPPESPDESRLKWLQAVVAHAATRGFRLLPADIVTRCGRGFCRHDGHLWQLTTWMPGKADYCGDSRPEKLKAAASTLAQFHRAVELFSSPSVPTPDDPATSRQAPSPGIAERLALVGRLRAGALRSMRAAVWQNRSAMPSLAGRSEELLELVSPHLTALEQDLAAVRRIETPLQPCLRDIGQHHVLFAGNCVSGIIDIGSMRMDSVATDLSRILGSLCGNDRRGWTTGLDAYEAVRPLSEPERTLLAAFDRSQMLLAGVKWVEWVFVEGRTFDDPAAVVQRMEHILSRLRRAYL